MLILDHKIEFFLSGGGDGGYSDIESRTVRVDVSKEWDTSLFQHVLSWKRIGFIISLHLITIRLFNSSVQLLYNL